MTRTPIPEFTYPKVYRTEDETGVRYEIEDKYRCDFRMSGLLWLGLYGVFAYSVISSAAQSSSSYEAVIGLLLILLVPAILIIRNHRKGELHLTFDARNGLTGIRKDVIPLASIHAFTVDLPPGVVPRRENPNPSEDCVFVYHGPNAVNRTMVVKVRDATKTDQPRQIRAACDFCYEMAMQDARPRSALPYGNDNGAEEAPRKSGPHDSWV